MTPLSKFTVEYPLRISPKVLFTLIATAEGLSRWFADRVSVEKDEFLFEWEGSRHTARLIECKELEFVRFEWTDDFHEGFILEMHISHQPVSGEASLVVSDFAEPTDMEFTQRWWNSQVGKLQRLFSN